MSIILINPYAVIPSILTDPNFANVTLLAHFDGADGSTTFTDVKDHTMTGAGNAQLDTDQFKFGTASLLLDGTGDKIDINGSSGDFSFGTGDFTIEFWIRIASNHTNRAIIGNRNASANTFWQVEFFNQANKIEFHTGAVIVLAGATAISNNAWHHVAIARAGTTIKLFINGTEDDSETNNHNYSSTTTLTIGHDNYGSGGLTDMAGWLDDIRLTKGVARYTSNFTPPTAAFPNS